MFTTHFNAIRLTARRSTPRVTATRLSAASRTYTTPSRACPGCSAPLPTALPTCPKCLRIEPLSQSFSYFDVFGLQRPQNPFRINIRELRQRFLQAQSICHPDAWSSKGEKEHDIAASQSAILNEAYKTLQSPILRAQYILTQEGYPPSETDKLTDEELIMEIMAAREALDEAESLEDVERTRAENQGKIEQVIKMIETLIEDKKWEEARDAVVELKYLEGIESAAKEKHHTLS